MTPSDPFAIELLGLPERPRVGYTHALIAWLRCSIESECFDRTLKGHWSPHEPECWIPLDRAPSLRQARALTVKTWDELIKLEISAEVITDAYSDVRDMGFPEQLRLLERLTTTSTPAK